VSHRSLSSGVLGKGDEDFSFEVHSGLEAAGRTAVLGRVDLDAHLGAGILDGNHCLLLNEANLHFAPCKT
jgi:hypothetical protein